MKENELGNGLFIISKKEFKVPDYGGVFEVICKHCGGKEFNVGYGEYVTAIKCIKCNKPNCIHSG